MDKKIELVEALEAYGLNKKQAKVYLACLELGLATVQDLAKRSGIRRTTIYSLLDDLEEGCIINIVKQKKKTFIIAQQPEFLLKDMADRKERIAASLPLFQEMKKEGASGSKFIFYRGQDGFKRFWRDLLRSGIKEWLIITSGKEFLSFVSENYITNWIIKEKKKQGIRSRQIITDSLYARNIIKKDTEENRESRLVDAKFPLPAIELVYGNRVAIMSSNFENLLVVIDSREVAQTHRSCFEMIWTGVGNRRQ